MAKNPPASTGDPGDVGLIPGLVRTLGEGNGNPFQYSYLENSMDRGAWGAESDVTEHTLTHTHGHKIPRAQLRPRTDK